MNAREELLIEWGRHATYTYRGEYGGWLCSCGVVIAKVNRGHLKRQHAEHRADMTLSYLAQAGLRRSVVSTDEDGLIDRLIAVRREASLNADEVAAVDLAIERLSRSSVVSTPDVRALIEEAVGDALGLWAGEGSPTAEFITDFVIRASAVSAPPTITDEALQRLREAVFAQSQRERSTGARGSGLYYPSIDAAATILRAALGGEA